MKFYFAILVCFISIEFIIGAPTPAPEPQFPFTVLPPPGKGHRKKFKVPEYDRNRGIHILN